MELAGASSNSSLWLRSHPPIERTINSSKRTYRICQFHGLKSINIKHVPLNKNIVYYAVLDQLTKCSLRALTQPQELAATIADSVNHSVRRSAKH